MSVPLTLGINASVGDGRPVEGPVAADAGGWGLRTARTPPGRKLGPEPLVPEDRWRDPQHGWGVLLPMPPEDEEEDRWSTADLAHGRDQPEVVQQLIAGRLRDADGEGVLAPVLRYDARFWPDALVRHLPDGVETFPAPCVRFGLRSPNEVPRYLLILAAPAAVPWEVQYHLAQHHHVGRLALTEEQGLGNYIEALLADFKGFAADPHVSTVWSTSVDDITRDIHATVAGPLAQILSGDPDTRDGHDGFVGSAASGAALVTSIGRHPGLIVTTGHGRTGPLGATQRLAMRAQLGVPVDQDDVTVTLGGWQGEGAIWYAHECCSAGAREHSDYTALISPGTRVHQVLTDVAALGSMVAPLPTALLGSPRPLRAFIGHVEPTFDWSLRSELTGQPLTSPIIEGLWTRLFQPVPVAHAMDPYRRTVGRWYATIREAGEDFDAGKVEAQEVRVRARLTALDRESLVILGDPTVALPPL